MTDTDPREVLRLVAAEFDRRGWEYDLTIGKTILADIERLGHVDAHSIAGQLPRSFFHRHATTHEVVETVIDRTIGQVRLQRNASPGQVSIVTDNRTYHFNIAGNVSDANINVGEGQQVNITTSADKPEILRAVEVLVLGALAGDWNAEAARELAATVDARDDVTVADVHKLTVALISNQHPKRQAVLGLARDIVAAGVGGALGTGIAAAVAQVVGQLPG